MCMEDIRIGRQLETSQPRLVIVPIGLATLCEIDQNRTRLIVSGDGSGAFSIGPLLGGLSIQRAWLLSVQTPGVVLRVEDWGKMLTWRWGVVSTIGGDVWVTEVGTSKQ